VRWCIWLLAAVVAAALSQWPATQTLDDQLHDAYTRWLPATPAPPDIQLVDIDERSLAQLGPWPWPRPLLARLSEALRARGARLQVWDLLLPESAPGDAQLDATLRRPDTVLSQVLVLDPAVDPPPRQGLLQPTHGIPTSLCSRHGPITGYIGIAPSLHPAHVGHVSATPNADGHLRQLPAVLCAPPHAYPQLALAAAQAHSPDAPWALHTNPWPWAPRHTLQRGPWRFALDERGWLTIPYVRPHQAWPAISAADLLDPAAKNAGASLQGRIVLIGATALGLGDAVSTPYHPHAPGLSIHAELLAAALAPPRSYPAPWPVRPWAAPLWSGLGVLLFGALLWRIRPHSPLRGTVVHAALTLPGPALLALLLQPLGALLPVWPATIGLLLQALAWLVWQSMRLRQESRRLTQHLQSFMPPALAAQIAAQNPSGDSLGQPCQGTLLALRVAGIERWVASVETLQALGLIHAIYASAQTIAAAHGGRLEHTQGHTLLLAWPQASATSVRQAMHAAQACAERLAPLLQRNETPTHPLSLHATIETGLYLLGIVGDTASRRPVLLGPAATDVQAMLQLNAELAAPILVGPGAAQLAEAHPHPSSPRLHRLGRFILPEQPSPKRLYLYPTSAPA